jgi:pyoverdine/dityrosine biosynthesis protein Dit1
LDELPDKGEELAIETLIDFIKAINEIYEPGALLYLVSDGRVFSDIMGISDETVSEYN